MNKPYAESCSENSEPILQVIQPRLTLCQSLLEIGSGTGQHGVYFSSHMPHIQWQTSDRKEHHEGIKAWLEEAALPNLLPPLALDVSLDPWPDRTFDGVFTANTVHIMSSPQVSSLFTGTGQVLRKGGVFLIYGPFNYGGEYTSDSNQRFDQWLKGRDSESGIKDLEWLQLLATKNGLTLRENIAMPANNRILIWEKNNLSENN